MSVTESSYEEKEPIQRRRVQDTGDVYDIGWYGP